MSTCLNKLECVFIMMHRYVHKGLEVSALTIGGIETCYILPQHGIAFDVGRCPDPLIAIDKVFLTHGHLDHAGGLPYYLGQRALKRLLPTTVYVPEEIQEQLVNIVKAWQKIEGYEAEIDIRGLKAGDKVVLSSSKHVVALQSYHRVSTLGYALVEKKKKLKEEYLTLPGNQIKKLKDANKDIFDIKDIPLFCFSGDSTIDFIKKNPIAQESRVLFIECTYIDEKRPKERAETWGHIHLDHILESLDFFKNEKTVLVHFSKRYSVRAIKRILKDKIPLNQTKRFAFIANNYPYEIPRFREEIEKYLSKYQK